MRFTEGERIGFGLALLGMGAGGAAMIWPSTRVIGYGIVVFAVFGLIVMVVHHAWERGWFRSHRKRLVTQNHSSDTSESAAVPIIEIEKVEFDPNGPTEMRLDIDIRNPSKPTILSDWDVAIFIPRVSRVERYSPRWLKFGVFQGPFGNIQSDDLSERPLETGARRKGSVGFTIPGEPPQQRFGGAGTKFRLSAKDVHGNVIAADYTLSHDMRA